MSFVAMKLTTDGCYAFCNSKDDTLVYFYNIIRDIFFIRFDRSISENSFICKSKIKKYKNYSKRFL